MEEANASKDWTSLAPEYPRPRKEGSVTEEERMKALKNSPEFKEMERAVIEYLKRGEDLFSPESPTPSLKDATDLTRLRDKGTEKVIEGLLGSTGKAFAGKAFRGEPSIRDQRASRYAENPGEA